MLIDREILTQHIADAKVVVDVGGGGDQLRSLHPNATHIIDIFEPSEAVASMAAARKVSFVVGDASTDETWQSLPAVDYTICSHTLEDTFDPMPLLRAINAHSRKGYIEFPSVAQEVLPLNSPYGSAHHSWFATVVDKAEILAKTWHSSTRPKNAIRDDISVSRMLAFLPKLFVYADGVRGYRFKVPHARRWKRRNFWRRPYIISEPQKSRTGVFWEGRVEGAIVSSEGFDDYRDTLARWVAATASHPYVFHIK